MNTKHTPGPWKVTDRFEISMDDGDVQPLVATVNADDASVSPEQAESDAAFIVHACNAHDDLLAAVELAEGWIDANRESEDTGEGQQARWILETMRAAIAKATTV